MKELTIKEIRTKNKQEMEHLEDIIEFLEIAKTVRHPMWPEQLKVLKEAFEAHDSKDWVKCRAALEVFFEYESPDDVWQLADFAPSYWNHRHLRKWLTMLYATELREEPEDSPARSFYFRLVELVEYQTKQQQTRVV
jgi:hypothetical protein